jgi:hypothetical protein
MMKRFKLAARVLFGLPLRGVRIDESFLLDEDTESEADYTKVPPFDLCFGGTLDCEPPEEIFREGRFRVCVFREKKRGARWLVLELEGHGRWFHLATLHETNLPVMTRVLKDVAESLWPVPANDSSEGKWVPVRDEKFFVRGLTLVHHADPRRWFVFDSAEEMEEFLVGRC